MFESYIAVLHFPQSDDMANINTAIQLQRVLHPSASVGVFYAGAIPFYTDFYAYDFLGKCDRHIALLPPDKSGTASNGEQMSRTGHNKYDLEYSILTKQPTYVESLKWGRQDVTEEALQLYQPVPVPFTTWSSFSRNHILLRKESPFVRWNKIDTPNENSEYYDHKLFQDCLKVGVKFDVTNKQCNLTTILNKGWYKLENWGIWSTANAEMQIDLPKDCQKNNECELKLNLGYGVFNAAVTKPKQVAVTINNKLIKDWTFNSWGAGDYSINIPLDVNTLQGQTKNIKIQFNIPAAESPKQVGMSEDTRILGMGLSAYQLIKRNAN